jgi:nicotinate dehydrogenase subunit B
VLGKVALSRREFLKSSSALVVSFSLFGPASRAFSQAATHIDPYDNPDYLDPSLLDSWLAIMPHGMIKVFCGKADIGTGVETALAQIVAEELDVSFDRIRMIMGDTAKTVDQGRTTGSGTVESAGAQLRQAAAAARSELLRLASKRLQSSTARLTVNNGVVAVTGQGAKNISYAELVGGRLFHVKIIATGVEREMRVAPGVKPKDYRKYKVVGTSVPRVDLPPKLTGEFVYTSDIHVERMLHGRVVRPRHLLSHPARVDEASITHIPGIVKVVHEGSFVGVVAETEWAAIQGGNALKVDWSEPTSKMPRSREELDAYLQHAQSFNEDEEINKGDVEAALKQTDRFFEGSYHWPFQSHGMMGPSCAVADVSEGKVKVWTGAQGPFTTRDRLSDMLGVAKRNIQVIFVESAGCYGRLTADDAAEDAVLMSRAVGKPVRVQWMRQDEHVWEPKGPQQLVRVRAGVDLQGRITAWDFSSRSLPLTEFQGTPQLGERQIGHNSAPGFPGSPRGGGPITQLYDIPNERAKAYYVPWPQDDPSPLRTCVLRAPGDPPSWFASESIIDEIASAFRVDPFRFRLGHLAENQPAAELLKATVKQSGWEQRPSPSLETSGPRAFGRGLALIQRGNTLVGAVAEVLVERSSGTVTVKRITLGHDCGLVVNPDGVKAQIEGNVIQGVSRTLFEEVQFDSSGMKSVDWNSYPVITFRNVPDVDIVLLNHPEKPASGAGEPAIVPIPAAIGNAIFDAVGARLREIPFTPERVLEAMRHSTATSELPSSAIGQACQTADVGELQIRRLSAQG